MKIAFCITGEDPASQLDLRFGRTQFFLIHDQEKNTRETFENSAKNESGGAGAMAVQLLADRGVDTVIVPELGPQALKALQGLKIPAYKQNGAANVQEALDLFTANKLEKVEAPGNKGLHRA